MGDQLRKVLGRWYEVVAWEEEAVVAYDLQDVVCVESHNEAEQFLQ